MLRTENNKTIKYTIKFYFAVIFLLQTNMVFGVEQTDIPAIDCMIEPNVIVELSSPVAGVLDTLSVDKSDEVKKGQVIALLKSDIEQVAVKSSQEKLKLSSAEYKRAAELYREKAITKSEKEQLDNNKKLAELELKQAKTSLDLRKIKSPIDGIVVKRYANPGEFVETKPILQLAQLNPLRIEVVSPVENYGKIVKGMQANILPEFGEYNDLVAKVVVVDKVVDAASGTFSVRMELENKDYAIPGGLKCSARFMPEQHKITEQLAISKDSISKPQVNIEQNEKIEIADKSTEAISDKKIASKNTKIEESKEKQQEQAVGTQAVIAQTEDTIVTTQKNTCQRIGPYKNQQELAKVFSPISREVQQVELEVVDQSEITYQVVSKLFESKDEAERIKDLMQIEGITDSAFLSIKKNRQLALGVYQSKASAVKRMKSIIARGFEAKVSKRQKEKVMHFAEIKYPSKAASSVAKHIEKERRMACKNLMIVQSE